MTQQKIKADGLLGNTASGTPNDPPSTPKFQRRLAPCRECSAGGYTTDDEGIEHNCHACGMKGYVPVESNGLEDDADIPEAPVWFNGEQSYAWSCGWSSGYRAGRIKAGS